MAQLKVRGRGRQEVAQPKVRGRGRQEVAKYIVSVCVCVWGGGDRVHACMQLHPRCLAIHAQRGMQ